MDDWAAEAGPAAERAAPRRVVRARGAGSDAVAALAGLIASATSPALVAGAGAGEPDAWNALVALAERLACPVYQESFGGQAGFPQDQREIARFLLASQIRNAALVADPALDGGHAADLVIQHHGQPVSDIGFGKTREALGAILAEREAGLPLPEFILTGSCVSQVAPRNHR